MQKIFSASWKYMFNILENSKEKSSDRMLIEIFFQRSFISKKIYIYTRSFVEPAIPVCPLRTFSAKKSCDKAHLRTQCLVFENSRTYRKLLHYLRALKLTNSRKEILKQVNQFKARNLKTWKKYQQFLLFLFLLHILHLKRIMTVVIFYNNMTFVRKLR